MPCRSSVQPSALRRSRWAAMAVCSSGVGSASPLPARAAHESPSPAGRRGAGEVGSGSPPTGPPPASSSRNAPGIAARFGPAGGRGMTAHFRPCPGIRSPGLIGNGLSPSHTTGGRLHLGKLGRALGGWPLDLARDRRRVRAYSSFSPNSRIPSTALGRALGAPSTGPSTLLRRASG